MPDPKVTTPEVEPKVEEQEQETPVTEPASPPAGEPQEQRDEAPEVTFQQLRDDPRFKEDWDSLTRAQKEAKDAAYQEGQSAGGKQADKKTREFAAQQEAISTFDDLEQRRLSQDPSELQEFANAMGKPKVKEAYDRGRLAKQGPGAEQMRGEIADFWFAELDTHLNDRKELQDLSDEEKASLAKEKHPTYKGFIDAKIDLSIKRGIAAGGKEASEKQRQEIVDGARRDLADELGMELPSEEIQGTAPARLPTKKELGKMSQEEVDELEREGKLDKILAGH